MIEAIHKEDRIMKRLTRTNLEKIVMIGNARIDQIIDKCCEDLESIKSNDNPYDVVEIQQGEGLSAMSMSDLLARRGRCENYMLGALQRQQASFFERDWQARQSLQGQASGLFGGAIGVV